MNIVTTFNGVFRVQSDVVGVWGGREWGDAQGGGIVNRTLDIDRYVNHYDYSCTHLTLPHPDVYISRMLHCTQSQRFGRITAPRRL